MAASCQKRKFTTVYCFLKRPGELSLPLKCFVSMKAISDTVMFVSEKNKQINKETNCSPTSIRTCSERRNMYVLTSPLSKNV